MSKIRTIEYKSVNNNQRIISTEQQNNFRCKKKIKINIYKISTELFWQVVFTFL